MIAAIVQARMASTRLPGKSLALLAGEPLIAHVCRRAGAARAVDKVVLATTIDPSDDPLAAWAEGAGVACVRGPVDDVLGRYARAAGTVPEARAIVRITADDPFKDPDVLDATIDLYRRKNLDFAYNNKPPSFPEGLDAEVFSAAALRAADRAATDPYEREHMTQHFYRHPARFKQANLAHDRDISRLRWTIDTPADLAMARAVYDALQAPGRVFRMADILTLLDARPDIAAINANEARSAMYVKESP
jgi:spore coat polysaccharide biosynthesis protein SpsF